MPSSSPVLLVVDVQTGFEDEAYWGRRNNPDCERNIAALVAAWEVARHPIVVVRHDSVEPQSPLRPGEPGNELMNVVPDDPALLITKSVNSAFYGSPDLHGWLQAEGAERVVICGLTTSHCCETTARMAGNLGYDVQFVIDATAAFDLVTPDGEVVAAEQLARTTAANLHGEFARVCATEDVIRELTEAAG